MFEIVDPAFEKLIDNACDPGDDYRNLRWIARITLYRLPLADCRKLFRNRPGREIVHEAWLDAAINAQILPPGAPVCYVPMRQILSADFFAYGGTYDDDDPCGRKFRNEYERLARLAVGVGYGEQIDALAAGVPIEYIFQGGY